MYYERKISMKLDSSTLFVNTGRKPLPAMQKKKKSSKNTVALVVCIAIIAVLCVFVGLIVHVWFNYNEETVKEQPVQKITTEAEKEKPKTTVEKPKKEEEKSPNKTMGEKTDISSAAEKAFKSVGGTYSFGIATLTDGYTYINNTEKIENTAVMGAFLLEYASNAIYMGSFDYSTNVSGQFGRDLMTRAFSGGHLEAAKLMIDYFGAERLNSYFASKGYENTHFDIGSDNIGYTTAEDLIKLMRKMYDNTSFFPYSDMYSKMKTSSVDDKIAANLPEGTYLANIGFDAEGEVFDAAIVYTQSGNFIFVSMAQGSDDVLSDAKSAMANAASAICEAME